MRRDSFTTMQQPHCGTSAAMALCEIRDRSAAVGTPARFARLARVSGGDVVVGKLLESHLDAMSIIDEILGSQSAEALRMEIAPQEGLWGVWASEGPAGTSLQLSEGSQGIQVSGRKSWCSGAADVEAALVTARSVEGVSLLVAVPMRHAGVTVTGEGWSAVGMAGTGSVDVVFDAVPARLVGKPGAYLERPGFWHGAAGVAACWHGAAAAIAVPLRQRVRQRGVEADGLLSAHLGAVDCALFASALALRAAAAAIDRHRAGDRAFGRREALQVRGTVEVACTQVIERVGRALGAAPLCRDAAHARRVADLSVFMRQSHAEWDLAVLGRLAAADDAGDDAWML